ncbi:MAG: N-acetylmuramoyl-L-alanine amidase [Spirochaetales bacterium]|nr:N-acetylmuramoyl-L-alanine amidase [Spirochaetales bacterium]
MVRKLGFLLLFALVLLLLLPADAPVSEVADTLGARFFWEPGRQTGMLSTRDHVFVFKPDVSLGIFDYERLIPSEGVLLKPEGGIFFSEALVAQLVALFGKTDPHKPVVSAIIIDPGHGGRDPGALGRFTSSGESVVIMEKDVVLATALHLYSLLKARYPEKEIILTRSEDLYLKLEERTELANRIKLEPHEAMIFVSLHANASFNTKASGYEVWFLPPEYRRDVIDPEDLEGVEKDVIPILNTMLEEEYTVESIILAKAILEGLDEQLGEHTDNRGLKEETWFVVRDARMPSVLIEMGFVTNEEEARLLSDPEYLKKAGRGIYNGVSEFIDTFERTSGFTE